jgi:hypothetical protein
MAALQLWPSPEPLSAADIQPLTLAWPDDKDH